MKDPIIEPSKDLNVFSKNRLKIFNLSQQLLDAQNKKEQTLLDKDKISLEEAYQIQFLNNQVLELSDKTRYWKTGILSNGQVFCAPINNALCQTSPANFCHRTFHALHVEAELAFRINRPFLAKDSQVTSPSDDQILATIDNVCVSIEVLDSRLRDWQSADEMKHLADNQMNGALVLGQGIRFDAMQKEPMINFMEQEVALYINNELVVLDKGSHPQKDPSSLLCDFIREANLRGYDILEDSWVTTGTWSGYPQAKIGDKVKAIFKHLGEAELTL
ncbi:hypothetical protein A9Q77_04870 [Marinomonas sp. 42_23_T18]|nr:hypothetical protein A9Q77_04870 [Marinomonas sp. 42_23_T18]